VRGAVSALLLFQPSIACAESTSGQEFSFISSFLQMMAALAIVIGLILVTRHVSGKLTREVTAGRFTSKHIRLVETRYIAPKKALILVEVGGEYLLLACSDDGLRLIKQIDMLEEIEVLQEGKALRKGLAGLLDRLRI
jgi:flagellar protein FliO/FliZ